MPKISAFQDSQTILKPNLVWIFLSVGANWNINICPRTPCRAGNIMIGHNFRKYLRSRPVAHVLDGASNSKPLLIQLGFVTNQQDFDSQETNFQRTGFDSISGISCWIWNNTKCQRSRFFLQGKVENILKGSLDSPSVKIQIMRGKVYMRCKGKTLLSVVNKLIDYFLKTKSLLASPSNVLPYYLK